MRASLTALPALVLAAAAPASAEPEEIVPGALYELVEPGEIPARIHLLTLDLTASELRFFATEAGDRGATTSAAAGATEAAIAINGGAFSPPGFAPYGIAVGAGEAWPDSAPGGAGALLLHRAGQRTFAELAAADTADTADIVEGIDAALAGGPALVEASSPIADFDCGDRLAMPCEPAPRTAVGVTDLPDVKLLVAVVDGWQAGSAGATAAELAGFFVERGAQAAMLLDGGSASTLFAEPLGGVVNTPSDGAERRVANHLFVTFEELPPGSVNVLVREQDIFDPGADLAGATVTLDDGRQDTTDAAGEARFADVRPRMVCATATADGFEPATECAQVLSGVEPRISIALFPEGEGPVTAASLPASPSGPETVTSGTAAGCRAAPGRLHDDTFHVTLGALLAVTFIAVGARRRKPYPPRRHRR